MPTVHVQLQSGRSYVLHTPSTNSVPLPALVAFHGRDWLPTRWLTKLDALIEDKQFVGVYPLGLNRSWNLGHEPSTANDVGFIDGLVAELATRSEIHLRRGPYALGFSNGAGLVHRLLCERPGLFAAAAVISTPLLRGARPPPHGPMVPIIQFNGMLDAIVPYAGGFSTVTGHTFEPAEESAALWAGQSGCFRHGSRQEPTLVTSHAGLRLEWRCRRHALISTAGVRAVAAVVHIGLKQQGHVIDEALREPALGVDGLYATAWRFVSAF